MLAVFRFARLWSVSNCVEVRRVVVFRASTSSTAGKRNLSASNYFGIQEAGHYYDWKTGQRFPPVATYENWRPHSVPVSPYQDQLSRRLPNGKYEPVQHVGLPDVHVEELTGTDSTSRTLLSVPARVPVVPFEGKF